MCDWCMHLQETARTRRILKITHECISPRVLPMHAAVATQLDRANCSVFDSCPFPCLFCAHPHVEQKGVRTRESRVSRFCTLSLIVTQSSTNINHRMRILCVPLSSTERIAPSTRSVSRSAETLTFSSLAVGARSQWVTGAQHVIDEVWVEYYIDGETSPSIAFQPSFMCGLAFPTQVRMSRRRSVWPDLAGMARVAFPT
jgi:hypothetical protein